MRSAPVDRYWKFGWHRWFAWRPVLAFTDTSETSDRLPTDPKGKEMRWVWWEHVERRFYDYGHGLDGYEYRVHAAAPVHQMEAS